MYTDFDESAFRKSVDEALVKVQSILGTTKNPRLAEEDHQHTYNDKFALAEFVSNASLAAQLAVLEEMGLTCDTDKLKTVIQWVQNEQQTVTLCFQAKDGCSFLKEQMVDVVMSEGETVIQTSGTSTVLGVPFHRTTTEKTNKHKMTQKFKEYHWSVRVSWSLFVYRGNDKATAIPLQARETATVIVTSGGLATATTGGENTTTTTSKPIAPIAESTVHALVETPLTWLLQRLDPESSTPQFFIDRSAEDCKTPRRNAPVDQFYAFSQGMASWLEQVTKFFCNRVEREILDKHDPMKMLDPDILEVGTRCIVVGLPPSKKNEQLGPILVTVKEYLVSEDRYRVEPVQASEHVPQSFTLKKTDLQVDTPVTAPLLRNISSEGDVFIPVCPLLEHGRVLGLPDSNKLLDDHKTSLRRTLERHIQSVFPLRERPKLVSETEASVVLLCTHWAELLWHTRQGIDYMEHMLRKQLVEAIGKEVNAQDFQAFMHFHTQRLFSPEFAPKPFNYAIRRPNHYPDGILSIETASSSSSSSSSSQGQNQSIETMVCCVPGNGTPSMFIPINAATFIEMTGDRYLHGWMQHRFESSLSKTTCAASSSYDFNLTARARQFSSFLLIVGTMAGPNKFDPKAAIILQNKDEVIIPLLSNVLPTAREFKDAIASLSPEQQSFCKAFRAMQLETSVFGVCVVQLKPQLEKLLGLPEGALTKEIQLTQNLMSLFVEHHVPSDLLSFDGDQNAVHQTKLTMVKQHVHAVMNVIDAEKKKQLAEEGRKADMRDMLTAKKKDAPPVLKAMAMPSVMQSSVTPMRRMAKMSMQALSRSAREEDVSLDIAHSRGQEVMFSSNAAQLHPPPVERMLDQQPEAVSESAYDEEYEECMEKDYEYSAHTMGEDSVQESTTTDKALKMSSALKVMSSSSTVEDFTIVPKLLDAKFAELDTDSALRSTILSTGPTWKRQRQQNLLLPLSASTLNKEDIEREKNNAFDLLDALSRSGSLPIACAEIHVVIAVSHCFENDVMGTVIQDNVNPIEKVEKSLLMVGSTIYGQSSKALLAADGDVRRLTASFPELFIED